jgi:hypothetical protein
MDILTTDGIAIGQILKWISLNEKSNPKINDAFRWNLVHENGFSQFVDEYGANKTYAALISDCKSDPLNCGRCAINFAWSKYRSEMIDAHSGT